MRENANCETSERELRGIERVLAMPGRNRWQLQTVEKRLSLFRRACMDARA